MARKKKETNRVDDLLDDCQSPEDILGASGLMKQIKKRLVERALVGELNGHLNSEASDETAEPNSRNGSSKKTVQSEDGAKISVAVISEVIESVSEDVKAWQSRPLDEVYPIVYLDALYVNIKVSGRVSKRAVYVVLGIDREGSKHLLGLWVGEAETEGAKFWLKVLTDLKNRGLKDILIACCDGLKGFPQAIEAVYPHTQV